MADARETSVAAHTSPGVPEESSATRAKVTKKTTVPKSEHALVIRTDFSDQATWEAIVKTIRTPSSEFEGLSADVELLDDPAFQGLTSTQLLALASEEYSLNLQHAFLMIVDHATIAEPGHPLLVVDLFNDEDWNGPEAMKEDGHELKVVESVSFEPQYDKSFVPFRRLFWISSATCLSAT